MKKISVLAMIAVAMFATSCGAKKAVAEQPKAGAGNPFGEVFEAPCQVYDTPTEFAATGIYKGSSNQIGEVHIWALQNAQTLVRTKVSHAYKGMISDYSSSVGNNRGNDLSVKLTRAGDQIIDIVLNNTSETCIKYSQVDDRGMVTCYVAIEISKEELAAKIASHVKDVLTDEEKMRIGFEEEQYRKQMEQRFKDYKDAH